MERSALITGATGGIGRAIAEALAPTTHLHLVGRDRTRLEEIAATLPSATAVAADLATAEGISAVADGVNELDVLVHSAGVLHMGSVEELTGAQWRESFDVNVVAPAELTRVLLPALRRRAGHVILINSGLGKRTIAGSGAYSASKHAMRALADALRLEEAPHGIRVTSVHPGRVDTPMQEQLHAWEGREYTDGWVKPDQVADVVLTAIAMGNNAAVNTIDIGPTRR